MKSSKSAKFSGPVLEGMGAVYPSDASGVGFRVWAPNASKVFVTGDFCNWDETACPLIREGKNESDSGTWYAFVPGAFSGQKYLYIIHNGDQVLKKADPYGKKVENSAGATIIWNLSDYKGQVSDRKAFVPPTLDQLVIYELHIGTFAPPRGDEPMDAKRIRTFGEAADTLPYLKTLGVNCVELMPVSEFAGDRSWGYNPGHPFAVESAYGGPEGLIEFIEKAHEQGIAVIMDVVYNHFGPSDLPLWQFDGWSENNNGGIYFYNDGRASTPWGNSRPDYGRGEVRTYLRDNALMWLRDYGADGLRWDMTVFIRTYNGNPSDPSDAIADGWSLMQWINQEIHKEFPRAITIAEDLQDSEWLVKDEGTGGAGFDAQWAAAFVHPIRDALITPKDEYRNLDAIVAALRNYYEGDAFRRVIYTESHDEVANGSARIPTEIDPEDPDAWAARKRALIGAALVCTGPGIPMIFQGQEFFEDEWFRDYVPLRWQRLEAFSGIHAAFQALFKLRLNHEGNTAGLCGQYLEPHHVDHERRVLAFRRWREGGPGDDTVVIINFGTKPVEEYRLGVPVPGVWHVRFNSDAKLFGEDFTNVGPASVESIPEKSADCDQLLKLAIGPYSVMILSQDK